jgi:predicted glycoside hydrolase/deacetylase ChbG (UPF0249 family)
MTERGLLIVNADDWGLSPADTDAILECTRAGAITSVTALVWMGDSDRAASLASDLAVPVGLHLNLIEPFDAPDVPPRVAATQRRVVARLRRGGLEPRLYHRGWAADFEQCIEDQLERFSELYGGLPEHFDGHRHQHLVPNALFARALSALRRCRRPVNRLAHESPAVKEAGRALLAQVVRARFTTTRWCFSLRPMEPAFGGPGIAATLAPAAVDPVEVIVHPSWPEEHAMLDSTAWREAVQSYRLGSFADLS